MDIRSEQPQERVAVRTLNLAAFGDHGLVVADVVDALRDAVAPDCGLSLVAVDADGDVVGQ